MLTILQFVIEWIILSSFWMFPSTLAKGMSEFVVYPFASSVATTKPCSITKPLKKKAILVSRSVKNLATDSRIPTNYAWNTDNDSNPSFFAMQTTPNTVNVPNPLHNEHTEDYDVASYSSDGDDDGYQDEVRRPQEFQEDLDSNGDEHPVQYRYFGKSRSRLRNHDSIPFILLGPSVDDWRTVGQNLAARGFSVMAASLDEDESGADSSNGTFPHERHERMVEAILEALRWNRAILVGCDGAAILAIKAALRLAPEGRVAGLLLCGDLSDVQKQTGDVDVFLGRNLACPFSVIWDGDKSTMPATDDVVTDGHRCLIRGGGSAPHRRLPEQFAWALTRFVEEQVAPLRNGISEAASTARRFRLPDSKFVTPGGLLVVGRVLAEVVFYVSAMKVIMFQYENIYYGILRINNWYKTMAVWPRRLLKLLGEAVLGWGGLKVKGSRRTAESSFEETIIMPDLQPQQQHGEKIVVEPEMEEQAPEPPVEVVPPRTTSANDHIHWPIPLINPLAV
ncbi:hypothetical protein MHU86_25891 [Fragilaria crotonensis]|nr:hypothetical protein MHU86_25891 [Fragilaria crotonensis]